MGFDQISQFRPNFTILEYLEYLEYLELGQFRKFCDVFKMTLEPPVISSSMSIQYLRTRWMYTDLSVGFFFFSLLFPSTFPFPIKPFPPKIFNQICPVLYCTAYSQFHQPTSQVRRGTCLSCTMLYCAVKKYMTPWGTKLTCYGSCQPPQSSWSSRSPWSINRSDICTWSILILRKSKEKESLWLWKKHLKDVHCPASSIGVVATEGKTSSQSASGRREWPGIPIQCRRRRAAWTQFSDAQASLAPNHVNPYVGHVWSRTLWWPTWCLMWWPTWRWTWSNLVRELVAGVGQLGQNFFCLKLVHILDLKLFFNCFLPSHYYLFCYLWCNNLNTNYKWLYFAW